MLYSWPCLSCIRPYLLNYLFAQTRPTRRKKCLLKLSLDISKFQSDKINVSKCCHILKEFFSPTYSPHDEQWSSGPRPVKLCLDQ